MKEELLNQLIQKSMDGLEKAADFLSAEIPDVIHQMLMWYAVKSAIVSLTGVAILSGIGYGLSRVHKRMFQGNRVDAENYFGFGIICIFAALVSLRFLRMAGNLDWLQIWIAPKLWLIEYAAKLTGVAK